MRHTTFRFALDPTPVQEQMFAQHAGASRFAYNQCLQFVTDALTARRVDPSVRVPSSPYDLINAFNAWKRSEDAGRLFVVAPDGTTSKQTTGLAWRHKISAQVFEEAAVDLGRSLSSYWRAQSGTRAALRSASPDVSAEVAAATVSDSATGGILAATRSVSGRGIRGR